MGMEFRPVDSFEIAAIGRFEHAVHRRLQQLSPGDRVCARDQVNGGPHQSDPHRLAFDDQTGQFVVLGVPQASPHSVIWGIGRLGLNSGEALDCFERGN